FAYVRIDGPGPPTLYGSWKPCDFGAWSAESLAGLLVTGLYGVLQRAPPRFVVAIPLDGDAQALFEIRMLGLPVQFRAHHRRIDGVAKIMTGPIRDMVEVVGVAIHDPQDRS